MATIISMLNSDVKFLPPPTQPAFILKSFSLRWGNIAMHDPPRTRIKLWFHERHCFPRMLFPVLFLVELLCDGSANDSRVESSNVNSDQWSKGFGPSVRLHHVPKKGFFPLCVQIICIFSPQVACHFNHFPFSTLNGYSRS